MILVGIPDQFNRLRENVKVYEQCNDPEGYSRVKGVVVFNGTLLELLTKDRLQLSDVTDRVLVNTYQHKKGSLLRRSTGTYWMVVEKDRLVEQQVWERSNL